MSLAEELLAIKEGAKKFISPEKFAVMTRANEDLRATGIVDRVLKVGDRLPSFALKNTEGDEVRSSDLLSQGAVVLTVFRGSW